MEPELKTITNTEKRKRVPLLTTWENWNTSNNCITCHH